MTEYLLQEVKHESVLPPFMLISSPYMEDEEDLLAWTNDLAYPDAEHTQVEPEAHAEVFHDSLPNTGRKRPLWESEASSEQNKRPAHRHQPADHTDPSPDDSADSSAALWQSDAMENVPAAFDSYNINDSLLGSPSLTIFKQEGPLPSEQDGCHSQQDGCPGEGDGCSTALQRLLQGTSSFHPRPDHDCRFQYVLAAATSISSKRGDDTLTYLNQGQSYGIKLKKVGELLAFKGKLLKSVVRLQFHERRLQYSEKEQILAWQASRPGERIVELDVPLSYGLFDVDHDTTMVNTLSFCWDPTQEVGAYVKVNSISTEFTPKKHGGEKGVPFRIMVETYIQGDTFRLHAAACQIRVFKLKGADRKHKQEREKWLKLPEAERNKFQPSYESTVLTDVSLDAVVPPQLFGNGSASATSPSSIADPVPPPYRNLSSGNGGSRLHGAPAPHAAHGLAQNRNPPNAGELQSPKLEEAAVAPAVPGTPDLNAGELDAPHMQGEMMVGMGRDEVSQWLQRSGFETLMVTFAHFSGVDMLRLTRNDLVTLCGLPHGTRLYYALRHKPAIRLTLYVSEPGKSWYHAVYLDTACATEFSAKLVAVLNLGQAALGDVFMEGPNGIHIRVTDDLLRSLNNEACFDLQLLKDEALEGTYCAVLNPLRLP